MWVRRFALILSFAVLSQVFVEGVNEVAKDEVKKEATRRRNVTGRESRALPNAPTFEDFGSNSVGRGSNTGRSQGATIEETGEDGREVFDSVLVVLDAILRKTQDKMKELLHRELRSREATGKHLPMKNPILRVIPLLKRIQRMHRKPGGLADPAKAIAAVIGAVREASAASLRESPLREPRGSVDISDKDLASSLNDSNGLLSPASANCGCAQWTASNEGKRRRGRSEGKREERSRNEMLRSVGARSSELALDAIDHITSRLHRMVVGFLG